MVGGGTHFREEVIGFAFVKFMREKKETRLVVCGVKMGRGSVTQNDEDGMK